jgi:glycosyltransferase involved in cell wall biosynthesis
MGATGFREGVLRAIHRLTAFSLTGDARWDEPLAAVATDDVGPEICCVINFYGRAELLKGILFSLAAQDLAREKFEVVMVEDRGGTPEGRAEAEKFGALLNIRYFPLPKNFGRMGYSRNFGLVRARGRYILFLDDDTVIHQRDFLSTLIAEFKESGADAIVPKGEAVFNLIKGRYGYHEPYYPTSRCMAWRADVLRALGGFVSDITGQEDVEFVIRYTASGRGFYYSEKLRYMHPPLIVDNLKKGRAVGASFAALRRRYPFAVWAMMIINSARYMPLLLIPPLPSSLLPLPPVSLPVITKWRMQGRFSLGFALGVIDGFAGKRGGYE